MKRQTGSLPLKALGKFVIVRFADHSMYSTTPAECEVCGFVEKINEYEVIIRWWSSFDGDSIVPEYGDENNEVTRLIQGTFIRWAIIAPLKWEKLK